MAFCRILQAFWLYVVLIFFKLVSINFLRQLVIIFLLTIVSGNLFATHIIGGEITYRCLGGKRYEILLTVYSDCGSSAVLERYYPIQYYATDLGILPSSPLSINVEKQSTTEVKLGCSSSVSTCRGGSDPGVNKVVYKGTVDLSAYEGSADWRFFWKRAARSSEIDNLQDPEFQDFFIESSINNKAASCNNSVVFDGPAVVMVSANQEVTFNNVAVDADGDQLQYAVVVPKVNYDLDVVYNSIYEYNELEFMIFNDTPTLSANSGDLTFSVNGVQVGVTDFKVEEYRDGELIGWVKRGIQVSSEDKDNTIPQISDFLGLDVDSVGICAGQTANLSFNVSDDDAGDQLTVLKLSGPSGVFSVVNNNSTSPTGRILWSTKKTDVGVHAFVIEAKDNVCPQPGANTKTFIINVLPIPSFELGEGTTLSCNEFVEINPEVTGGTGDYTYLWNGLVPGPDIDAQVGEYILKVTDELGCYASDTIIFESEMTAAFMASPQCFGVPTQFTDLSGHTSDDKNIVRWEWDFGDGTSSFERNPQHTYAAPGRYTVTQTITDNGNPACSAVFTNAVTICGPPDFNIIIDGICSHNVVSFTFDATTFQYCDVIKQVRINYGDGTIEQLAVGALQAFHEYETGGVFDITVEVENLNGCTNTKTVQHEIHLSPLVNIIESDFFLVCSAPDTVLHSEILDGGTGNINYLWSNFEPTEDIEIDKSGYYSLLATDDLGCSYEDQVSVTYPLSARFNYDPYCKPGDVIQFNNNSSSTNTITDYSWNFGDSGPDNLSALREPTHDFTSEGDYNVSLKVEDDDGCIDTFSATIYNTSLDKTPVFDLDANGEICLRTDIKVVAPTGPHVDSYLWDFDNGATSGSQELTYKYTQPGTYDIKGTVFYNNNIYATGSCDSSFTESLLVHPLPVANIISSDERICKDEEIVFSYESDDNIQSVLWTIRNTKTGAEVTSTDETITFTFAERNEYRISLEVTDINGCNGYDSRTEYADVVSRPDFTFEKICAKEPMLFKQHYQDTLENITDYRWDFGDGTAVEEGQVPMPMITHAFPPGGPYDVTLTVLNRFSGCEKSVQHSVTVINPPLIDFEYPDICEREEMQFVNLTTERDGTIAGYEWIFPDGSASTEENAKHTFPQSGYWPVSLISTSSLGCRDTLTREVYVHPAPVAGVDIPVTFVEAFIPMQFYDDSEGDIVSYSWDFGDGATSDEKDPIHTYDAIEKFLLKHTVVNTAGCSNTYEQLLDLNVYLDIPTAFSPNDDLKNDEFKLIQQGIKVLHTFKLYNRHGQVVFDANGDVNAIWDGEYKGKRQPAGVYVVHVQASGAYDTEFNFKKNLTLLR